MIMANIPYLDTDSDTLCSDLETVYNTVYDNEYGSSSQYTVPIYLDNTDDVPSNRRNRGNDRRERFGVLDENDYFSSKDRKRGRRFEEDLDMFELIMIITIFILILLLFVQPYIRISV